ncbi:hypothetical protein GCM10020366_11340 [Saccharopolyspora gregorii]|uniref:RNA 3'-terminal phosphate cyclase insert domain-containing protein n=1 Tax=Saccharopolyspora gregorii TaxID=33914 RepID=A0ABP6RKR7_9PSEU
MVANLSGEIMRREVNHAAKRLAWESYDSSLDQVKLVDGAGNCFAVHLDYEHVSERFTDYGAYGLSAERVAGRVVKQVREFLKVPERRLANILLIRFCCRWLWLGRGASRQLK